MNFGDTQLLLYCHCHLEILAEQFAFIDQLVQAACIFQLEAFSQL